MGQKVDKTHLCEVEEREVGEMEVGEIKEGLDVCLSVPRKVWRVHKWFDSVTEHGPHPILMSFTESFTTLNSQQRSWEVTL